MRGLPQAVAITETAARYADIRCLDVSSDTECLIGSEYAYIKE
jgi:hypothetical protein